MHIFLAENFFWQNGRNFCPLDEFKVKNLSNLVIFWILRENKRAIIWPEIEISGRFLVCVDKISYILAGKNFFDKTAEISALRLNLKSKLSKFILKIHVIYWKIPYFRHFWRIFDILWPEHCRSILYWISKDIYMYLNKLDMNFGRNWPTYSLCIWPTILENRFFQKMTYFPAGIWPI